MVRANKGYGIARVLDITLALATTRALAIANALALSIDVHIIYNNISCNIKYDNII